MEAGLHTCGECLFSLPVLPDLFSEFPVVTVAAARDAASFPLLSAVPVVSDIECLDVVQLGMLW
jgi:hypothetical protein